MLRHKKQETLKEIFITTKILPSLSVSLQQHHTNVLVLEQYPLMSSQFLCVRSLDQN